MTGKRVFFRQVKSELKHMCYKTVESALVLLKLFVCRYLVEWKETFQPMLLANIPRLWQIRQINCGLLNITQGFGANEASVH